jgi:thioredoxin reductase (NADPH)
MAARALAHEKLEFHWDSVVTAIGGDHDEGVTSVTLKNVKTDAETEHPWKALFIAIGHKPNTGIWQGILDLDEAGYIITKPDSTYTNVDGIFACGDVQDSHYRQAITAAGTGCMSAIDAERWLEAKAAE